MCVCVCVNVLVCVCVYVCVCVCVCDTHTHTHQRLERPRRLGCLRTLFGASEVRLRKRLPTNGSQGRGFQVEEAPKAVPWQPFAGSLCQQMAAKERPLAAICWEMAAIYSSKDIPANGCQGASEERPWVPPYPVRCPWRLGFKVEGLRFRV